MGGGDVGSAGEPSPCGGWLHRSGPGPAAGENFLELIQCLNAIPNQNSSPALIPHPSTLSILLIIVFLKPPQSILRENQHASIVWIQTTASVSDDSLSHAEDSLTCSRC